MTSHLCLLAPHNICACRDYTQVRAEQRDPGVVQTQDAADQVHLSRQVGFRQSGKWAPSCRMGEKTQRGCVQSCFRIRPLCTCRSEFVTLREKRSRLVLPDVELCSFFYNYASIK